MSQEEIDVNDDGIVNQKELEIYEQRAKNRRRMAWVSLAAMIVTAGALMFFVPDERLAKLDGLLELYWIALGGVVGAYVGISAWTKRG
jgi:cytochrome bd-type quinol oxidase subunit 2